MPIYTDQRDIYFDSIAKNSIPFKYIGELYFVSPELFKYSYNRLRKTPFEYSVVVPPDNIVRFYLLRKKDLLNNGKVLLHPFYIKMRIIINNGSTDMIIDNISNKDILQIKKINTDDIYIDLNFSIYEVFLNLNNFAKKGDNVIIKILSFKQIELNIGEFSITPQATEEYIVFISSGF